MLMEHILVVGCGLSGCVIAEQFANNNFDVTIIESRDHIAGNCYDFIDDNGILVSKYGAHIFHTNNDNVWKYVNKFSKWNKYEHKVLGKVDNKLVPIPVNINTVNSIMNTNIDSIESMNEWLKQNQIKYPNGIMNGEEAAKNRVGEVLYEKIFKHYTKKQWDKYPIELNASVLQRIPIRNNWDPRYFTDKYQGLPKDGYTEMIKNIIKHPNINVHLNIDYNEYIKTNKISFSKTFYTGPIDHYFSHIGYPKLEYRSIRFEWETYKDIEFYQDAAVINYPGNDVDYTRIVEFKHFMSKKKSNGTTIVKEYSTSTGDPYYPVLNSKNIELYEKYKKLSEDNKNIIFVGRLANFKYFNMDQAIENALNISKKHLFI